MKRKTLAALLIIVIVLLGVGIYILLKDSTGPVISLSPETGRVSPKSAFTLNIEDPSGLKDVTVRSVQGEIRSVVFNQKEFNGTSANLTFTLGDSTKLHDGAFEMEVIGRDASLAGFGQGNPTTQRYEFIYDTQPPRVSILNPKNYLRKGGAGCLVYTVSKDVLKSGVMVGDHLFPGYKTPGGEYVCLFVFPYDADTEEYSPTLYVEDYAGNEISRKFIYTRINRKFKNDTLNLPQSFLDDVSTEFYSEFPGEMSSLDRYLKVNRELRDRNAQTLAALGQQTATVALWQGPFTRLPNSAPRAGFADHRTYMYQGQPVDEQTHLGVDLASLAQSNIPAANAGRVIFASDLGIYGLAVVIDHGLGLQTLYAHMSHIDVAVGQDVAKDEIIGQTGITGLAAGDHLHFGVLVSGVPVTPIEWWDNHWLKDNILDRMPAGAWAPGRDEFKSQNLTE